MSDKIVQTSNLSHYQPTPLCMGGHGGNRVSPLWPYRVSSRLSNSGKIRHLKNTLEVCCQNSGATDFTGYSWTLAKDYATKLSDEIEQGKTTWQQLPSEVKTSTLMSATMENPRPVQRSDPKKIKLDDKKDTCLTFNKCMTENKCDYEVANPTKTCQRKHECSWCRSNRNQSWKHQEWKCRNKAGGAISTTS